MSSFDSLSHNKLNPPSALLFDVNIQCLFLSTYILGIFTLEESEDEDYVGSSATNPRQTQQQHAAVIGPNEGSFDDRQRDASRRGVSYFGQSQQLSLPAAAVLLLLLLYFSIFLYKD
jgi:hypothetical protein